MITDLMMIPQVFTKGTWETPLDIWQTTSRKKMKDNFRRVYISDSKEGFRFQLENRKSMDIKKNLHNGLSRVYPGFGPWNPVVDLQIKQGLTIFTTGSFDFQIQAEELNQYQVSVGIYYEPRNVSAEDIGRIPSTIPLIAGWSYPENGIARNND